MEYFVDGTSEIHANTEYYWREDTGSCRIGHSNQWPGFRLARSQIKRAPTQMIPAAEYEAIKDAALLVGAPS